MQKCGFGILELRSNIARQAEVGILIDGTGDQAGGVGRRPVDLGKRVREGRGGLDGREVDFAYVVSEIR